MREAVKASPEHPVLIDRFLKDAIEVDLDLVADRTGEVLVGGVLEHIEEAGVHSGDAAATLPPHSLSPDLVERMKDQATALARELGVVGLMNVQFAIQGEDHLRPGGEPARVAHGAVRLQGHRRAAGEDRRAVHGGQDARGAGPAAGGRVASTWR